MEPILLTYQFPLTSHEDGKRCDKYFDSEQEININRMEFIVSRMVFANDEDILM